MRKKFCAILIAICMLIVLAGCDSVVGYWTVQKIEAGEVVMQYEDAESLGFTVVGSFKFQKSGSCEITLLGEESKGTWEQDDDGTINITVDKETTYTGSVDDEGVMTLTDAQSVKYILKK